MTESNAKQADFPKGARVLPNPNGTAPGFCVRIGEALAFFMPGVPREMSAMFQTSVAPVIAPLVDVTHCQVRLRTFGIGESEVNDRLQGIESAFGVVIGYRATAPMVEVKVLAGASSADDAQRRARLAADEVRRRLGAVIFGEGDITFPEALGRELVRRRFRIACAESCTGGLIGQLLTARAGASAFFAGSAVVYENAAKIALLGLDPTLIAAHGAVSAEVARAMAQAARARFEVDVALGVTGIAGPDGGTPEKPVGLVHYAVATRESTHDEQSVFVGDRELVRARASYAALALAYRTVRSQE